MSYYVDVIRKWSNWNLGKSQSAVGLTSPSSYSHSCENRTEGTTPYRFPLPWQGIHRFKSFWTAGKSLAQLVLCLIPPSKMRPSCAGRWLSEGSPNGVSRSVSYSFTSSFSCHHVVAERLVSWQVTCLFLAEDLTGSADTASPSAHGLFTFLPTSWFDLTLPAGSFNKNTSGLFLIC